LNNKCRAIIILLMSNEVNDVNGQYSF